MLLIEVCFKIQESIIDNIYIAARFNDQNHFLYLHKFSDCLIIDLFQFAQISMVPQSVVPLVPLVSVLYSVLLMPLPRLDHSKEALQILC